MKLVCQHDPHNPDHLVCSAKWSFQDVVLGITVFVLVIGTIFVVSKQAHTIRKPIDSVLENNEESQQYSGQSGLYLTSQALYFSREGEQVGRGPWPPKIGETTKIKVFWNFGGVDNDMGDNIVAAKLGGSVVWTGFVPIGESVAYDRNTGIVQWNAKRESVLVFEVSITPSNEDMRGNSLLILEKTVLRLLDKNRVEISKIIVPDTMLVF